MADEAPVVPPVTVSPLVNAVVGTMIVNLFVVSFLLCIVAVAPLEEPVITSLTARLEEDATVNSITVTRNRPASASIAGDATATATAAKIFFFDPALFTKGRAVKVTFQERRTVTVENQQTRKAFVSQDPYRNVKVAA